MQIITQHRNDPSPPGWPRITQQSGAVSHRRGPPLTLGSGWRSRRFSWNMQGDRTYVGQTLGNLKGLARGSRRWFSSGSSRWCTRAGHPLYAAPTARDKTTVMELRRSSTAPNMNTASPRRILHLRPAALPPVLPRHAPLIATQRRSMRATVPPPTPPPFFPSAALPRASSRCFRANTPLLHADCPRRSPTER